MKEYSTYIFDLDGTLLNTIDDLTDSVNHALRAFGMPEHSVDDIRSFVGNGVGQLVELAVEGGRSNPQFEDVLATFRRYYMEHSLDKTGPYAGVLDVLAELKRRGKRIAVVSNKFYAATQSLCRHFFGDYVEVAIGEREDIRRKPAPDTVFEALLQLSLITTADVLSLKEKGLLADGTPLFDTVDAVYVGDSDVDLATARAAGLPCINVLWGFRDRDFLLAKGADTFAETPKEIVM